ncbi:hypothetical protein [Asticcacaulis sp. YBE204]|uniref:hypothetical protein n=1 Tax=Asticcacaulis sp. YBE204 TaxID=1282363 RepID=UPI0003C3D25C|nr:hypothetical protein [Asticcacaulis sp. YBE204]ESQ78478.1 hypothetical protein AEYBE204_13060 [Asticcacaulis sp. YBE204]
MSKTGNGKRRKSFNPEQLGFTFDAPETGYTSDGALRGLDRVVADAVGLILVDAAKEGDSRWDIATAMSRVLDGDDVTKSMLDAYAAPAKDTYNISFHRFLVLVAVTGRYDVLRMLTAKIGATVLVGEEAHTAHLGHLIRQEEINKKKIKALKQEAPLIGLIGGGK